MTVIRPNSISGITSLTAHRGSIDFYAHDGSAARFDNINSNVTSGVSTFASLNITGDLDVGGALTYEDVTNIDSVGVITARNGIHVTGGDVGIGTDDPQRKLSIKDSGNTFISIENSTNVTSGLIGANSSGLTLISRDTQGGSTEKPIQFITGSTEKVRITSAGNFGIGTDNPDQTLELFKASGTNLVKVTSQANSTVGLEIEKTGSTTQSWRIADGQTVNGALEFYDVTNTATRMIIRNGKVGINDNNPDTQLSVNSGATNVVAKFASTDQYAWIQFRDNSTTDTAVMVGADGDNLLLRSGSNERLRITSDGKMGLGISSPARGGLHIHKAATAELHLTDDNTGSGSGDGFTLFSTSSSAGVWYRENAPLRFATYNTERVRISSGGNVGINETAPDRTLHVNSGATDTALKLESTDTEVSLELADNTGSSYIGGGGSYLNFYSGGNEKFRIRSGGEITSGQISINAFAINNTPSGYSQFQSDNHANTIFGQNLKLGASAGSGNHQIEIINQHATIGGAGMYIGGNGSNQENAINFYAESANQSAGTDVTANRRAQVASSAFFTWVEPRNLSSNGTSYLRTFGFTFNLQEGETETLFYNPDSYRRIWYEIYVQSGHGSNGYGYILANISRYGMQVHDVDWHVSYTSYAFSGSVGGNVVHNGIKFTRNTGYANTNITYYVIVKAFSPAGGSPYSNSGLTDPTYRYFTSGY